MKKISVVMEYDKKWTKIAAEYVKDIFIPAIKEKGFSGTWPVYHRNRTDQIDAIWISVTLRSGINITLGLLPNKRKPVTRISKNQFAKLTGRIPSLARGLRLGRIPLIGSERASAAIPAKPKKLAILLSREGESFWSSFQAS
jgi:hypothetical protein